MDPLTGMAIGQGANLIGGMIANRKAEKAAKQNAFLEQQRIQEALSQMGNIEDLSEEDLRVVLENPELVGELNEVKLGESAMEGISLDPRYKEAQMKALSQLQEMGETGLTEEDRIEYDRLREDATADEMSRQKSILQNMAQTGTMDSGNALIAKLQSNANSTQRAMDRGRDLASQGAASRRDAISRAAQMAGNMQQNDFNREGQVASAKDLISQYNARNRQNVQDKNLNARQNIENTRADNAGRQSQNDVSARKGVVEQQWNRFGKEQSLRNSGAKAQQGYNSEKAKRQGDMWSGIGNSVGNIAATYSQYKGKQANKGKE